MKLTILLTLLFSFSSFAQVKVEIIKANESTMHFEMPTLNKAVKHLKKLILAKKRFKGEWSEDQAGYIFDRELSKQVPNGLIVEEEVMNHITGLTATIAVPQYDTVITKEYFIPSNFSVIVTDITAEMEAIKAEQKLDKDERKEIKVMLKDLHKYDTVKEWRDKVNKLLRRLVKDNNK